MYGCMPYSRARKQPARRIPARDPRVEPKSERLEFRVTASAKKVIQRAAALSGLSAADLAYEGARRILNEHEYMELSEADRRAFLKALISPPAPSAALVRALKRHALEIE